MQFAMQIPFFGAISIFNGRCIFTMQFAMQIPFFGANNVSKEIYPRIDIIDAGDAIQVHAETPHFNKQDITIKYEDGVLNIRGTKDSKNESDVKYIRREIKRSNFSRSFAIDASIYDVGNIQAAFNDGILQVNINKLKQPEQKPVFINIK
jgi:HSP20 family protein